jgi:3-oxoacyl-[acyl-carrier-protein] synthase II
VWWQSWKTLPPAPLTGAPAPAGRARVLSGRASARVDGVLADSPWARVPRFALSSRVGDHEGASGFAVAAAAGAIARGELDVVLVIGDGPGRAVALVLAARSP